MPDAERLDDLLSQLPHLGPARLPDRVRAHRPGERVVAERTLAADDPALNEEGAFPAMLLVELMAQTGGLLIEGSAAGPGAYGVLAGIKRMHLHAAARAGETITVECSLSRRMGDLYLIDCRSRAGDRELAHGGIHLRRFGGAPSGAGGRS